jgi:hypothetical protein
MPVRHADWAASDDFAVAALKTDAPIQQSATPSLDKNGDRHLVFLEKNKTEREALDAIIGGCWQSIQRSLPRSISMRPPSIPFKKLI